MNIHKWQCLLPSWTRCWGSKHLYGKCPWPRGFSTFKWHTHPWWSRLRSPNKSSLYSCRPRCWPWRWRTSCLFWVQELELLEAYEYDLQDDIADDGDHWFQSEHALVWMFFAGRMRLWSLNWVQASWWSSMLLQTRWSLTDFRPWAFCCLLNLWWTSTCFQSLLQSQRSSAPEWCAHSATSASMEWEYGCVGRATWHVSLLGWHLKGMTYLAQLPQLWQCVFCQSCFWSWYARVLCFAPLTLAMLTLQCPRRCQLWWTTQTKMVSVLSSL